MKPRYQIYGGFKNYGRLIKALITQKLDNDAIEEELKRFLGVGNLCFVPMCRMGIFYAVRYFVQRGFAKVCLSPYTISDVVNMVILAGASPVFVDIELQTLAMDPDKLEALLDEQTQVLVTHLHGVAANIELIAGICKSRGLPLIEDCAQSLGAKKNERYLGNFGDVGVFSFGLYKNINSFYGGLLVSPRQEIVDAILYEQKSLPRFPLFKLLAKALDGLKIDLMGRGFLYHLVYPLIRYGVLHDVAWINRLTAIELDTSRLKSLPDHFTTNISPAQKQLVAKQWQYLNLHSQERINLARIYQEGLPKCIKKPPKALETVHVYSYYPIVYERADNLIKWLQYFGQDVAKQHLHNCAGLPSFAEFFRLCPVANMVASSVILLPSYATYGRKNALRNIEIIQGYFLAGEPEYSPEQLRQAKIWLNLCTMG